MGSEGFEAHIDGINAAISAKLTPAALKAVEFLRTYVAAQTPVETGQLVGSEAAEPLPDGAQLMIPGPYARRQHYELTYHHNTGNALYLELPWMQHGQEALDLIAADLGEVMDK